MYLLDQRYQIIKYANTLAHMLLPLYKLVR